MKKKWCHGRIMPSYCNSWWVYVYPQEYVYMKLGARPGLFWMRMSPVEGLFTSPLINSISSIFIQFLYKGHPCPYAQYLIKVPR